MSSKTLCTAEHIKIVFIKFAVTLLDRRNGKQSKGEAIEILSATFDVDEAQRKVEKKYAELGYSVYDIEIAGQRTFDTTALELYETLPDDELGKPVQGMTDLSGLMHTDGANWRKEAEEAAKRELKGDI